MQIGKILFTVAVVLGTLGTSFGQNLNNIQRGQRGYIPPPLPREQGAIAIDNTLEDIDEKMDLYAAEFELDAFEKAVVKNYIVEYENEKMALLQNENITYDVKQQSILKLNDKLGATLSTMLTEDQVSRFGELHFGQQKKKKKKKKKRGKDN